MPANLTCVGGIAMYESPAYPQSMSVRIDYRGHVEVPTLGRSIQRHRLGRGDRDPWNGAVWRQLEKIMTDHLAGTSRASGDGSWLYRQRLSSQFELPGYWDSVSGLARYYSHGKEVLASIGEVAALPYFTITRVEHGLPSQPRAEPAP